MVRTEVAEHRYKYYAVEIPEDVAGVQVALRVGVVQGQWLGGTRLV